MKKMKMRILGGASLALLGAGAIASIPIIMTSCAKKTSLSDVKFETKMGTVNVGYDDYDLNVGFLQKQFIYINKDVISDFTGIDMYFNGSCTNSDSLSVFLSATSSCKKFKGNVEIQLSGNYVFSFADIPIFTFTGQGYLGKYEFNINPAQYVDGTLQPTPYDQKAPTYNAPQGTTLAFDFFGEFPNAWFYATKDSTTQLYDGGFQIREASSHSKPASGTFAIFVLASNTSGPVGWNMFFFHWTHL